MSQVFTTFLVRFPDGSLLSPFSIKVTKQKSPASLKTDLQCELLYIIVLTVLAGSKYARMVLRFESVLRYKQLVLPLWHVAPATILFWQQHLL